MHAALRLVVLLVAVVDQRVEAVDCLDNDIAAAAAIPPVRAAERNELLAPERDAPIAPPAGFHVHLALVEEFHRDKLTPVAPSGHM